MSEGSDYTPAHWDGHNFDDGRKQYAAHIDRSYDDAVSTGIVASDLVPKKLVTKCSAPFVITVDHTGSMGEWPKTMFSKLPYLELEAQEYLGKDMEISWGAVGDHKVDSYPIQARPFIKGTELKDELMKLVIEGGGGGNGGESYEMTALYYARNVEMPNAIKPVFIFIGDEPPFPSVSPSDAATYCRVDLQQSISTKEIFAELMTKFEVFMIRKPYGHSSGEPEDFDTRQVRFAWEAILPPERIAYLADPNRVVDVIFGLLAQVTDRVDYFRKELTGRQNPNQVKTVLKSLKTVHVAAAVDPALPALPQNAGRSRLLDPALDSGKKTKKLI